MRIHLALCISLITNSNVEGAAYQIDIWASIEVNTGLICASAAALKPLIRKILPNFLTSISERSSRRNHHVHLNENGYLRATSRGCDGGAIKLTDRSHHTDSTRVAQSELRLGTSDKVLKGKVEEECRKERIEEERIQDELVALKKQKQELEVRGRQNGQHSRNSLIARSASGPASPTI